MTLRIKNQLIPRLGPAKYSVPTGFSQTVPIIGGALLLDTQLNCRVKKKVFSDEETFFLLLFPWMANPYTLPSLFFFFKKKSNENILKTCLVVRLCGRITPCSLSPSGSHSWRDHVGGLFFHALGVMGHGPERDRPDPCPRSP